MNFTIIVAAAALFGGTVAVIAGFGMGSIVTPLLAIRYGMEVAVPLVAVPHICATALRFWFLRKAVDRRVLLSFGVTSAVGGLTGAVLHASLGGRFLELLLAVLLLFTGTTGLLGIHLRFRGRAAWVAGAVSGVLGGLVGNQGGLRAGAMLGFDVRRDAFIATTTAVGLMVDIARVPVYLVTRGEHVVALWPLVVAAAVAAIIGTIAGRLMLRAVPENAFRRVVSAFILLLGVVMLTV